MKRAIAIALVALAIPATAHAVYQCGDQVDTCQCGANNPYPCCDNGGNCTWYAWEAACCAWGVGLPGWGNANQWHGNAAANASYQVLSSPVVSSIANNDTTSYGHVAFTTSLNGGGNISVHEENCWGGYGMDSANYSASWFTGGFIVRAGQVACSPGDSQTQSCGNCGTQSRGCGNDGAWGGWGACSDEGACKPGDSDSEACGTCGTHARTCNASCQWDDFGACSGADPIDAGSCDAGLPGPCGVGELRCVDGNLACAQVVEPKAETCNGVDDDCDGVIDVEEDGGHACEPDAGPQVRVELPDGGHTNDPKPLARLPEVRGSCASIDGMELLALLTPLVLVRRKR